MSDPTVPPVMRPERENPPAEVAAERPQPEALEQPGREGPPAQAAEPPAPEATEDAPQPEVLAPAPDAAPAEAVAESSPEEPSGAEAEAGQQPGRKGKKRRGKSKAATAGKGADEAPPQRPANFPPPDTIVKRIGKTNAQALAYVQEPDPQFARLSRKVQEALLPELPPVTAAALLGPAALTRHFVAAAAAGRYRDLFALWDLFRLFPEAAKPELAERSIALEKGRQALRTSVRLGLTGNAQRVAEDVAQAQGLIWQWLRDALLEALPTVATRPAIAAALLRREPALELPLPEEPDEGWLHEAAAARAAGPLPPPIETLLGSGVHRLPATVATLRLATLHYPERVASLVDRVDLNAPEIGAFLAWARDHGAADRLHGRIREQVAGRAARDRTEGLALWYRWLQRGVRLELPEPLRSDSLEGFDLGRPETAELAARLVGAGTDLDLQGQLETLAGENPQRAEKAYEAMVCAGLDVRLPASLEGNPAVRDGTRCPNCRAWTWVRPGHELRCPRPPAPEPEPAPDPFELAAAEASAADGT